MYVEAREASGSASAQSGAKGGAILLSGAGPNRGVWPAGALAGHPTVGATNLDSKMHRLVFT